MSKGVDVVVVVEVVEVAAKAVEVVSKVVVKSVVAKVAVCAAHGYEVSASAREGCIAVAAVDVGI